jgi:hypothetical protein
MENQFGKKSKIDMDIEKLNIKNSLPLFNNSENMFISIFPEPRECISHRLNAENNKFREEILIETNVPNNQKEVEVLVNAIKDENISNIIQIPGCDSISKSVIIPQHNQYELLNLDHLGDKMERKNSEKLEESEIKKILQDINFKNDHKIRKSFSMIEDDYLKIERSFPFVDNSQEEFENYIKSFDKTDLKFLSEAISGANLQKVPLQTVKIGPISTLDFLVESSYKSNKSHKESMMNLIIKLENAIFRWRSIGGDGNCYFRGVMFAYLEYIILNADFKLLRKLILECKNYCSDKIFTNYMNLHKIKSDLSLKILVIIYLELSKFNQTKDQMNIQLAYEYFLKSINFNPAFDLFLIYFFRFKMFNFIKKSENKLYSKEFSVKIGNLLPAEYESEEGEFYWEKFYEDYLMKLYKDAEKIVIYLTPFILEINVKILIYDIQGSVIEQTKEFPCPVNNHQALPNITLLLKKNHYDLIYEESYFQKFNRFFCLYVNLNENLRVVDSKMMEEINRKKQQSQNKPLVSNSLIKNDEILIEMDLGVGGNNYGPEIGKGKNSAENVAEDINNINEYSQSQYFNVNMQNYSKSNLKMFQGEENVEMGKICKICNMKMEEDETNFNLVEFSKIFKNSELNLCKECLKNEVKSQIYSKYLSFLQLSKHSLKRDKDLDEIYKLFTGIMFENKLKLNDSLLCEISPLCKYIGIDFKTVLEETKRSICTFCEKPVSIRESGEYYSLPCECILCSPKCLKQLLDLTLIQENRRKCIDYICVCGTIFQTKDIKLLFYFCHSNNYNRYKERIITIFLEKIKNKCMKCLTSLDKEARVFQCELKDGEVTKFLKKDKFFHNLCNHCFNGIYERNESILYCDICDSKHNLVSHKSNKYAAECNIF